MTTINPNEQTHSEELLEAYVLDALIRRTEERTINIWLVLSAVIMVSGLVVFFSILDKNLDPFVSLFILGLFGFSFVMFYFKKLKSAWFRSLFLVMLVMDLGFLGFRYMPLIDKNYYEQEPLLLQILREDPVPYRIYTGKIHGSLDKLDLPKAFSRVSAFRMYKEMMFPSPHLKQ